MSTWSYDFQVSAKNERQLTLYSPRKHLYSYYDEAISKILLSKAEKFYIKKLKETAFSKLNRNLNRKKSSRRQILRANVHYKYSLRRKMFFLWSFAIINRKQELLTFKIIDLHYNFKIKCKCWIKLKNAKRINALRGKIADNTRKIIITLFLHINVAEMAFKYYTVLAEYGVRVVGYKKLRIRKLTIRFQLWKLYTEHSQRKRRNQYLCKQFQKSRYNPEQIRPNFEIWHNYTQISIIDKLKLQIAQQQDKNKLQSKCFLKLRKYKNNRQTKTQSQIQAVQFYSKTLSTKSFTNWVYYKRESIKLKGFQIVAHEFYVQKLASNSFVKLKTFAKQRIWVKQELLLLTQQMTFKLLYKYFIKLKRFHHAYKVKIIMVKEAEKMHGRHLVTSCLRAWQKYAKNRKNKLLRRQEILMKTYKRRRFNILQKCFKIWNVYRRSHQQKKLKVKLADAHIRYILIRKAVTSWVVYINDKHVAESRLKAIKSMVEQTIVKQMLVRWKNFVHDRKLLEQQIMRAKDMHRECLIKEGIRAIMIIAYKKQQCQQQSILKSMHRKYTLALKYFKLWKYKALKPTLKTDLVADSLTVEVTGLQVTSMQSNFEWNPVCFEEPRVQQYFKMFDH